MVNFASKPRYQNGLSHWHIRAGLFDYSTDEAVQLGEIYFAHCEPFSEYSFEQEGNDVCFGFQYHPSSHPGDCAPRLHWSTEKEGAMPFPTFASACAELSRLANMGLFNSPYLGDFTLTVCDCGGEKR